MSGRRVTPGGDVETVVGLLAGRDPGATAPTVRSITMPSLRKSRAVQGLSSPLRKHLGEHTTRIVRRHIDQLRTDNRREIDRLTAELAMLAEGNSLQSANLDAWVRLFEDTSVQLAETRTHLAATRKLLAETRGQMVEMADRTQHLEHQLAETRRLLVEMADQRQLLGSRIDAVQAFTDEHAAGVELLLGARGRHVSRVVAADAVRELAAELATMSDGDDVITAITQAYRLLFELEIRGLGRFAGGVSNILGKLAAVSLLRPVTGDVLEIGTLFGVGAVGVARQLSRQGLDYHLTIVDPFAGHQVQPDLDETMDVSQTPATKLVVEENLALGGVAPERFRLIEGLSTSPEIRARASDKSYGLIVIDGNHSDEVAYNDLLWAQSVAAPGALVILDDYQDSTWPGVEAALERYLARTESTMVMIGSAATTAFLRA